MPRRTSPAAGQLPDPFEPNTLVLAGPRSRVGFRCPTVRTATTIDYSGEEAEPLDPTVQATARQAAHRLGGGVEVTLTVSLQLIDGLYPGRYVLTDFTARDVAGTGLSPERIRAITFAAHIAYTATGGMRLVVVDPETHTVVDHAEPARTLRELDDVIVANWLQAKLCGLDPNKVVAQATELTPGAVAQRIKRLRDAKVLLPAERMGKRR